MRSIAFVVTVLFLAGSIEVEAQEAQQPEAPLTDRTENADCVGDCNCCGPWGRKWGAILDAQFKPGPSVPI